MRILVTGAGGFAGGHIARRLAEAGFEVIATTRRSVVEPPGVATAARRFRVVEAALEPGCQLPKEIDGVVHAAATSIWNGITVDQMVSDNIVATQAVIRHALIAGVRAFILFSSVSAFGRIGVRVLTEAEPSIDVDAYGITKLLGEKLLEDRAAALSSVSIRLPAVIGRGSSRNWPSESLRKLKAGDPLEVFNVQAPFNNVIHEADLAALVAATLGRRLSGAEIIVVGSAGQTTVERVVRIMADGTNSTSPISFAHDRPSFLIDSGKAIRLFGFAPMDVEEAVSRFVTENA